jgi:hypothetical protein
VAGTQRIDNTKSLSSLHGKVDIIPQAIPINSRSALLIAPLNRMFRGKLQ